ncbi:tyrosine protein phosphatase 1 [Elasticomyces elasticus]|uniref:Tyrosine protein phosphatase 1 n=1 Tax=Elasticomyces elasticus TaxID=574655 RepID=A0AAN7VZ29_9PEZI|nr:tyrosine protein phosphatase 1 [Elasticomyces elasticus]
MARHRHGSPYGIPVTTLGATEVHIPERYDTLSLLCMNPRIIDHSFYMRIQQWATFTGTEAVHWVTPAWDSASRLQVTPGAGYLSICSHMNWTAAADMTALVQCKTQHNDQRSDCATCHPLLKCGSCSAEFQVSIQQLKENTRDIVITKWFNLGSGEAPSDPQWRRHMYTTGSTLTILQADRSNGVQALYEQQAEKSYMSLTEENERTIIDMDFQHSFEGFGNRKHWIRGA